MSESTGKYRATTVPVRGGDLAVGVWGPDDGPTVLAIHGLTASHRVWELLAQAAPDLRIIAPDLRGRGRSNGLPGPWGMATHAADMAAVLEAFDVRRCVVIGHSMGAFVSTTLTALLPDVVGAVILVDGGLPLPVPEGVSPEDLPKVLIGPAADRLSMSFTSYAAYRDYWRVHPALAADWSPSIESYVDYDLTGSAPQLTPCGNYDAIASDTLQLSGDVGYADMVSGLPIPVRLLWAPRGLLNQEPGLYTTGTLKEWQARIPGLTTQQITDVNHYTIVMARRGAGEVLSVVRDALSEVSEAARTATAC